MRVTRKILSVSAALAALNILAACGPAEEPSATTGAAQSPAPAAQAQAPGAVDMARLLNADAEPDQWMATGRDYWEQHYSPLDSISVENISELGLAWYADLNVPRTQEATPLMVDGVLYVATSWSNVQAFDARTGERLWTFDSEVPGEWAVRACCDVVNRGVAVWNGKAFVGTIDGRLIAIDSGTGEKVWEADTVIDRDLAYTITGAPRMVKGKVVIGNGGAEYGVRGYVSAYDAESGELDWRFFTVPGDPSLGFESPAMAMAAETWAGEWWKLGGGGTVWDGMAYDPELDLLYLGVGNGSPWNRALRSAGTGDNLFLASIVAVDPDDGSYAWHFQTVPGESWDYTATQPIMVAELEVDGQMRKVVMQAPKNGFFYVLDAATGAFISGAAHAAVTWATGLDPETGRPIENPEARYEDTGRAVAVQPSFVGAHSWHPMAYSPRTGLVYLPSSDNVGVFAPVNDFAPSPLTTNTGVDRGAAAAELGPEATSDLPQGSYTVAWNPATQEEGWRIPGDAAGILATAGGFIVKGDGSFLVAYEADDGEELWRSQNVNTGIVAAPISYAIDGEQYIAVVAGRSLQHYYAPNYSRLLVFRIGGAEQLPPPVEFTAPELNPPPSVASAEVIAQGERLYQADCFLCHGEVGNSGGVLRRGLFPELALSPALNSAELFSAVVLDGVRAQNGMASFAAVLSPEDAEAIRAYLIERANITLQARQGTN